MRRPSLHEAGMAGLTKRLPRERPRRRHWRAAQPRPGRADVRSALLVSRPAVSGTVFVVTSGSALTPAVARTGTVVLTTGPGAGPGATYPVARAETGDWGVGGVSRGGLEIVKRSVVGIIAGGPDSCHRVPIVQTSVEDRVLARLGRCVGARGAVSIPPHLRFAVIAHRGALVWSRRCHNDGLQRWLYQRDNDWPCCRPWARRRRSTSPDGRALPVGSSLAVRRGARHNSLRAGRDPELSLSMCTRRGRSRDGHRRPGIGADQ